MFDAIKLFSARKLALSSLVSVLAVSMAQAGPLTRAEIGELFIFGFAGQQLDSVSQKHFEKTCPGSVLLFRRNLVSNQQTAALTDALRKSHRTCSRSPLFIALDQEGGQVARIPFDPPMPSPWAIGAANDLGLAEELGLQVGQTLRRLGFNMNLAPVLDLGNAQEKSFIGSRSFGTDPVRVGQIGTSFSLGLIRSHVLPVAKHFPGLGAVINDPHQVIVRRPASLDTLWTKDLKPFQEFALLFPTGIMPSHLVYPQVDRGQGPGTFSKVLLKDWLRERLNFQGLVVSDDLLMKGAQASNDIGKNVVAALQAGVDIVMVSWSRTMQSAATRAVQLALQKGTLSENDIRSKIERIRKVKTVIGDPLPSTSKENHQLLLIGSHRYTDLTYSILKKNLVGQSNQLNIGNPTRIFIWPNDLRTKWHVERALQRKVLTAGSPEFQKLRDGDLVLAFVRNKKAGSQLNKWNAFARKRTLIVNQIEPGLIENGFLGEVEVFMQHPMLPAEIARSLGRRWNPSVVANDPF